MAEPKYKRVLIKLSGEALAGEKGVGIDLPTVQAIAKEIAEVADSGIQIALVIGGGNLWRGEPAAEAGMDRVQADYTGMPFVTLKKGVSLFLQQGLVHHTFQQIQRQHFVPLKSNPMPSLWLKMVSMVSTMMTPVKTLMLSNLTN